MEGVGLIATTTLLELRGEEKVRRLLGTEQGPVIFQRSSYYLPCCL